MLRTRTQVIHKKKKQVTSTRYTCKFRNVCVRERKRYILNGRANDARMETKDTRVHAREAFFETHLILHQNAFCVREIMFESRFEARVRPTECSRIQINGLIVRVNRDLNVSLILFSRIPYRETIRIESNIPSYFRFFSLIFFIPILLLIVIRSVAFYRLLHETANRILSGRLGVLIFLSFISSFL